AKKYATDNIMEYWKPSPDVTFPYPRTNLGRSQRKKLRYQEAKTLAQGHE
ncbi:hypothetical protein STEG23_006273, partial [Scotinomys teguina]